MDCRIEETSKACFSVDLIFVVLFLKFLLSNTCSLRASLVAHLVKNPPVMWETWVGSLGWEDHLEKGTGTHSSILAWRIPWTKEPIGHKGSDVTQRLSLFK